MKGDRDALRACAVSAHDLRVTTLLEPGTPLSLFSILKTLIMNYVQMAPKSVSLAQTFFFLKVSSMLNMVLEIITLRSRVTCSTD